MVATYRYTITWKDFSQDDIPLLSSVFSVSSRSASRCKIEYNTPLCDQPELPLPSYTYGDCISEGITRAEFSWMINSDIDVIFSYGHAHIGTIDGVKAQIMGNIDKDFYSVLSKVNEIKMNTSTSEGPLVTQQNNDNDNQLLCISQPSYGELGSPDESFLVSMSACRTKMRIHEGSVLKVSTNYNARATGFASNRNSIKFKAPYDGAMGYFVMYYVPVGKVSVIFFYCCDTL